MKDYELKRTEAQKFSASEPADTLLTPFSDRMVEPAEKIAYYASAPRFVDQGGTHLTALDDW